jgi:hypothetical protein
LQFPKQSECVPASIAQNPNDEEPDKNDYETPLNLRDLTGSGKGNWTFLWRPRPSFTLLWKFVPNHISSPENRTISTFNPSEIEAQFSSGESALTRNRDIACLCPSIQWRTMNYSKDFELTDLMI